MEAYHAQNVLQAQSLGTLFAICGCPRFWAMAEIILLCPGGAPGVPGVSSSSLLVWLFFLLMLRAVSHL